MEENNKTKLIVLGAFLILAIGMSIISIVDTVIDDPLSDDDLHFDKLDVFVLPHICNDSYRGTCLDDLSNDSMKNEAKRLIDAGWIVSVFEPSEWDGMYIEGYMAYDGKI